MNERSYQPPTDYPRGWRPRYQETGSLHCLLPANPYDLREQPVHRPEDLARCQRVAPGDALRVESGPPRKAPAKPKPEFNRAPIPRQPYHTKAGKRRARILAEIERRGEPQTLESLRDLFPDDKVRHDLERMRQLRVVQVRGCIRPGKSGHVAQYWVAGQPWPPLPEGWILRIRQRGIR